MGKKVNDVEAHKRGAYSVHHYFYSDKTQWSWDMWDIHDDSLLIV